MSRYVIGDIQGCFSQLMALLEAFGDDPASDELWLAGDLVNRGPESLEVLRWCVAQQDRLRVVLGNHDLHLVAMVDGYRAHKGRDTLEAVLEAPDRDALVGWLRAQPLLLRDDERGMVMVHAGLHPSWSLAEAERSGEMVSRALRAGEKPPKHETAVLTRMRCLDDDGGLDGHYVGPLGDVPEGLTPWFRRPHRRNAGHRVYFGHWAAIGYHAEGDVVALDSGCVWGGKLTAHRVEDGAVFQVPGLPQGRSPS